MTAFYEFAQSVAFAFSIYVLGACICRLRMAGISKKWSLLYTAVFANACWCLWDLIYTDISARDTSIIIMTGIYILLTRPAWGNGVPMVARRSA